MKLRSDPSIAGPSIPGEFFFFNLILFAICTSTFRRTFGGKQDRLYLRFVTARVLHELRCLRVHSIRPCAAVTTACSKLHRSDAKAYSDKPFPLQFPEYT
jgi:hypothetical protein